MINEVITISEAAQLDYTPSARALRGAFKRGVSFQEGWRYMASHQSSIDREYADEKNW